MKSTVLKDPIFPLFETHDMVHDRLLMMTITKTQIIAVMGIASEDVENAVGSEDMAVDESPE